MDKEIQKIPTLSELYTDKELTNKQNKLNTLLNAQPKPEWVKTHHIVKNLKYLPIERMEYLLTVIFTKWRVEIKEVKILANSIVVNVRVYVKDPITGEWDYQDGVGATPIQVEKGSKPTNFEAIKSSAIQLGCPSAESYAIKDACEKFGKIFGKDLNRRDNISYGYLYQEDGEISKEDKEKIIALENHEVEINKIETLEELTKYAKENAGLGKEFMDLISQRKNEITNKNT
jgi:hypothetical protein